jgi:DNA-binding CsgD family transcriptional regulator
VRVAQLVADGLTDRQVAERTGIAVDSIHTTVKTLLRKTRCHTRAQLVAHLMRAGRIK